MPPQKGAPCHLRVTMRQVDCTVSRAARNKRTRALTSARDCSWAMDFQKQAQVGIQAPRSRLKGDQCPDAQP